MVETEKVDEESKVASLLSRGGFLQLHLFFRHNLNSFQKIGTLFDVDFCDGLFYEGISFSLKLENIFLMATCHSTLWLCILYLTTCSLLTI